MCLKAGRVRFIDLEGKQAIDFLAYNAHDPSERYNAADTMKYAGTIFLTKGHGIYTDMGRKLFTIVEDTCGRHDTIGGCCSAESNQLRYTDANTPNCRDTFLKGPSRARPRQEGHRRQPQFLHERSLWKHDGTMALVEGYSQPGDLVELQAEMDVLALVSNCPQTRNPVNAFNPTPIRIILWQP